VSDLLSVEEIVELSPGERKRYLALLKLEQARVSPLDLAEIMFPETRRWPQIVLLNDYLVALSEYRLTAEGPVPADYVQWWYVDIKTRETVFVGGPHDLPEVMDEYGAYDEKSGLPIVFRLSVNMRPRSGKSLLVTEVYPIWLQLKSNGTLDVGVGTYSDDFAASWGEKARDFALEFVQDNPWFPSPKGGIKAPRMVFTTEPAPAYGMKGGGKIRFAGVGGGITGKTLNVLVGDDFIKNDQEAQSSASRAASHSFYDKTWLTRRTKDFTNSAYLPIPVELLMGTRWNADDVSGHAVFDPDTREPYPDWCVLNIPALAIDAETDPLGREVGEGHPNATGETRVDMEKIRTRDPRGFSALYQGNPSPEGGGLIPSEFGNYMVVNPGTTDEYFTWTDTDKDGIPRLNMVQSQELVRFTGLDVAATKKTTSDWTVAVACGYSREHSRVFILDLYRKRITTDEYVEEIVPFVLGLDAGKMIIENITYGQKFRQDVEALRREGVRGLDVDTQPSIQDKVARITNSGLPTLMRHKHILVQKDAGYLSELVSEIGLFPYDSHDDQVDALAFAVAYASTIPPLSSRRPKRKAISLGEEIDAHVEKQVSQGRRSRLRSGNNAWSGVAKGMRRR
jgi:predicted phage terminase large subunit-like protein